MTHAPSEVVRQWLVDAGLASDQGAAWPAFDTHEPDAPDDCLTVYTTDGKGTGRHMPTGKATQFLAVQVRVRSVDAAAGWLKAGQVRAGVEAAYNATVAVGASRYLVQNYNDVGSVLTLGMTPTSGQRTVHTLNFGVNVRQTV